MLDVADGVKLDESLDLLEQVDEAADRFEAAWRGGGTPQISQFLEGVGPEARKRLLDELIALDQAYRARRGLTCSWEDYLRDFPELGMTGTLKDVSSIRAPAVPIPHIPGYQLLEKLGSGGMGTVYRARQLKPERFVAIKVLRAGAGADPREVMRLNAEAEAAARLQHPNIVQIYEVGQHDGCPYLTLELADAGTLADKLGGKPQPPAEAAALVETLARAVHYSHGRGVVHRDLKPANVLLTEDGTLKITDFGLAKRLEVEQGQTQSGTIMGTPAYMAPEQAEGKTRRATAAIDIYALGVILYEALTGEPPFRGATVLETLEQVRSCEPVAPSRLRPKIPRDLDTICLTAMNKDPARRYAAAAALADDLGAFRRGEPIRARPLGPLARSWRWCKRKPAWAALTFTLVLLLTAVVVGSLSIALIKSTHEQDRHREALLQRVQLIRQGSHGNGWSDRAWELVVEAQKIRGDELLRNQAAASCEGLDARLARHVDNHGASWVCFDRASARLLLGGRNDASGRPLESAQLWDDERPGAQNAEHAGAGPVAFGPDGTPLLLLPGAGGTVTLRGLAGSDGARQFQLPPAAGNETAQLAVGELALPLLALAPDGSVAAAATDDAQQSGRVIVWETAAGRLRFQAPVRASALAISPSAKLLAAALASSGSLHVWSTSDGKRVAVLGLPRVTALCLAFSPDEQRLAVGDSAGMITIWELATARPIAYCHGSRHGMYALAFGPDGTVLAGGGRGTATLWDAATGQLILTLQADGTATSLAFSPDARRLAIGTNAPGNIFVWNLDYGRGSRTVRGLAGPASHLCFSADGRRLAALAHNWKIAIWDVAEGRLLRQLDAPVGGPEGEAAVAFSADGERFACSAGGLAKLWDVHTGTELGAWHFPAGVGDVLCFNSAGMLTSFRAEAAQAVAQVPSGMRSFDGPWTCPLRSLTAAKPLEPIRQIEGFDRRFFNAVASPDGAVVVAEGTSQTPTGPARNVKCFDGETGVERWSIPSTRTALVSDLILDPAGRYAAVRIDNRGQGQLFDVASGKPVESLGRFPLALSPNAEMRLIPGPRDSTGQVRGYSLVRRGDAPPLVVLGIDRSAAVQPAFSPDGTRLAWGNHDGTVSVCELEALRQKLASAGLQWEIGP